MEQGGYGEEALSRYLCNCVEDFFGSAVNVLVGVELRKETVVQKDAWREEAAKRDRRGDNTQDDEISEVKER